MKADYKPWGFRSENGDLVGMEIDMAQDVADTLGVELELVSVQSSNRMQFLEQGKIDMMIATMSDRADRRKLVGIVQPELLHLRHQRHVAQGGGPEELGATCADKPVCGKQGAFYNKIVEERYGAKVIAFTGNAEAKQALRDKKCIAWVYDDSLDHVGPLVGQLSTITRCRWPPRTTIPGAWPCRLAEKELRLRSVSCRACSYNWHQLRPSDRAGRRSGASSRPQFLMAQNNERFKDWLAGVNQIHTGVGLPPHGVLIPAVLGIAPPRGIT